jgi:phosphoribosylformimino-5-aminoimidazole carboxamide ribotide isomerase
VRIIPAIDILHGKCVRLLKGDYSTSKVYRDDPLEVAKEFEDHGIKYLHVVDLDGAKSKHIVNHRILERICTQTTLQVDFGGGLKSEKDLYIAFNSGAHQITAGSIAVNEPERVSDWIGKYGSKRIILGADHQKRKVAVTGWTQKTDLDVVDFIESYEKQGIVYVICTDIDKDGMLQGPSFELYAEIIKKSEVKLIASGGVSSMEDIAQLNTLGCDGAIVGKALYEGRISLNELKELC